MDLSAAKALILRHEGLRYSAYRDSVGKKTIGIGFNLDAPGAKTVCEGLGINYALVYAGNSPLTETQVQALFNYSFDLAFSNAHSACPQFDSLKEGAQQVLTDMAFELGYTGLSQFRHFLYALALSPPDYLSAAEGMRQSKWYIQVPSRAQEDVELMLS